MRTGSCVMSFLVAAILGAGLCSTPALQAAEKKPARPGAAQGGRLFGIVTAKTDKDITIKTGAGGGEPLSPGSPGGARRRTFRPR